MPNANFCEWATHSGIAYAVAVISRDDPNQAGYNFLTTLLVQDLVQVAGATIGGTTVDVVSSPVDSAVACPVASATPSVIPSTATPTASGPSPSASF